MALVKVNPLGDVWEAALPNGELVQYFTYGAALRESRVRGLRMLTEIEWRWLYALAMEYGLMGALEGIPKSGALLVAASLFMEVGEAGMSWSVGQDGKPIGICLGTFGRPQPIYLDQVGFALPAVCCQA